MEEPVAPIDCQAGLTACLVPGRLSSWEVSGVRSNMGDVPCRMCDKARTVNLG